MSKRVVIIGGGPGGYPAALLLAQKGAKVTLIERDKLGGTCVNRGCIPTKVLLHAANLIREIRNAQEFGITARDVGLDFSRLRKRKDQVVGSLVSGVERLCEARKIRVIKGTGFFETPRRVRVRESGELIEGDAIVVATGSVPATVPIKGSDGVGVIDSNEALSIEKIPPSIVVIGAGYIGLEFAQIFHALGSGVTVLELLNQVLPNEDADVSGALARALNQEGIKIRTGATVRDISGIEGHKTVHYAVQGKDYSIETSCVLMAVGRRSNTEGLALEKVGLKTENGRIVVDNQMKTTVPGIYAVGDVTGGSMLAHVATAEGLTAAENILGKSQPMNYTAVPRCIYTYPEAASVGMTEREAREAYGEILIGRFPLQATGKARILGGFGFAKLISEKKYKRIVGVHLVGPRVTDLIAEAGLAMNLECTAEEMAFTMHPHPTLSEILMESAMQIEGYRIHST
ncbi:MAG: dihydrolipoyl dehydrogenase [Deltaproteobacteria bacterium]|nr:dihydrolipoyl dehydrogenase [Deltaproteobacteria bacterium]